ncbi:MAG: hypothetical protein NPMRTH4_700007 [Nitrosopumilales archaeon]|nr:MAG: hypothetical protein NPMRTH4_700007 [Nitrosopumilales archaeon]
MNLQSKFTVYVAIGAMFALMGGIVYYASLDNPSLEQAEIKLHEVKVVNVNTVDNLAQLEISFLVKNPSEKTFTVPLITFELFANGEHIGTGQYSTTDVSMPGRAAFFGGTEIPLKTLFEIARSDIKSDTYQNIIDEEDVEFSAEGIITVETAWSLIEKEFKSSI